MYFSIVFADPGYICQQTADEGEPGGPGHSESGKYRAEILNRHDFVNVYMKYKTKKTGYF